MAVPITPDHFAMFHATDSSVPSDMSALNILVYDRDRAPLGVGKVHANAA
jgi:hypothetical protein